MAPPIRKRGKKEEKYQNYGPMKRRAAAARQGQNGVASSDGLVIRRRMVTDHKRRMSTDQKKENGGLRLALFKHRGGKWAEARWAAHLGKKRKGAGNRTGQEKDMGEEKKKKNVRGLRTPTKENLVD